MELLGQPVGDQRLVQRVDPVGDVQRRALVPLRQEVAHRPVERSGHADGDALDATMANDPSMPRTASGVPLRTRRARVVE